LSFIEENYLQYQIRVLIKEYCESWIHNCEEDDVFVLIQTKLTIPTSSSSSVVLTSQLSKITR